MKLFRSSYRLFALLLATWMISLPAWAGEGTQPKGDDSASDAPAAKDKEQSSSSKDEASDGKKASEGDKASEQSGEAEKEIPPLSESLQGQAKADYEAGKILYRDGDYGAALIKFQRAYERSHDGRLLWNMAVCQKQLRHYVELLKLVERYRQEAGDKMTEDDKRHATALINAVKQFVSKISVETNVKGAQVFIDGKQVAVTPMNEPILVDMGDRTIEIKKEGYLPYKRTMQVSGNTQLSISAMLQPDKNEGELAIIARPGDTIWIDGRPVGKGSWHGTVTSGSHTVRVSAPGMRSYQNEVDVPKHGKKNLHITLEKEVVPVVKEESSAWMWIAGGAVILAGAGVGTYFLLREPGETRRADPRVIGTISPGTVILK